MAVNLVDAYGRPVVSRVDSVYDPRSEEAGYMLPDPGARSPEFVEALRQEVEATRARIDAGDQLLDGVNLDTFVNQVTGLGTLIDKSRGGFLGGPAVQLYRVSGTEADARYRASDLGHNIVDKRPNEMTREGWDIEIQPTDDEQDLGDGPAATMDQALREPRRAAAGWRRIARWERGDRCHAPRAMAFARRWDAVAQGLMPAAAAPPPPPGPLPKINDEGADLSEAIENSDRDLRLNATTNQALRYERAFGGGCIFVGVDDGGRPLTEPLDLARVRRITHLTALTGGYEGEAVMWRPYNIITQPKFGQPEIYQVRNLNVQLARPPAPGEGPVAQNWPRNTPGSPMIFYVHESRMIIFDGQPTTRQTQQELRGWGDSIFTRTNDPLMQFEQTWNAVAVLMQEFSIATLAIKGLNNALSQRGQAARAQFINYAQTIAHMQSIAKMKFIDSEEVFSRVTATVSGVAEILREWNLRLAAASDEPVSVLMGQVQGGLGAKEDPSIRGWYDGIASEQRNRLQPALERYYRILFASKQGPTKGVQPKRWSVVFRPLWQPNATERADNYSKVAAADGVYIDKQVVKPEEVAAKRFGGAEFDDGPIVLDLEARAAPAPMPRSARAVPAVSAGSAVPAGSAGGAVPAASAVSAALAASAARAVSAAPAGSAPGRLPPPSSGAASVPVPPMRAMPADPITGDPTSTPSEMRETGAGGKGLPPPPDVPSSR